MVDAFHDGMQSVNSTIEVDDVEGEGGRALISTATVPKHLLTAEMQASWR